MRELGSRASRTSTTNACKDKRETQAKTVALISPQRQHLPQFDCFVDVREDVRGRAWHMRICFRNCGGVHHLVAVRLGVEAPRAQVSANYPA